MKLDFKRPSLWDRQTKIRAKKTKDFIGDISGTVLGVGAGELEKWIYPELDYTLCDLDCEFDAKGKYDNIFCFEVLEHLFNPLFCLENIKKHLRSNGKIFISIPKRMPHFLCGKNHFHEFDKHRFRYMIEYAGLKIIKQDVFNSRYDWSFYFTGIRPILRLLFFKPKSRIYLIQ